MVAKHVAFFLLFVGMATSLPSEALGADEPVRLDLRLIAADLIDEVAHTWLRSSPFPSPTPLIVAEVDAPIGIDHRFSEAVENHLFEVLRANPKIPIELVHCSLCRQWVAVSQPKKTVIGRALSQPEGLEILAKHPQLVALALHFDVVANDLVLWAEIYEVKSPQRVVWSRRYSQSTSARAVLQESSRLVSLSEAREEQERLLKGRDLLQAVTRFPIRSYQAKDNGSGAGREVAPLIFLEQSLEAILTPQRSRRLGLALGLTSLQGTMQGWSFGAHYAQLLGRREPSLTQPDLYFRVGVNYLRLEGPGAAVFSESQIDVPRLLNSKEDPRASLTAWQIGLEAHVKYRFGINVFIEYSPQLDSSNVIASQRLLVPFHAFGASGVLLW